MTRPDTDDAVDAMRRELQALEAPRLAPGLDGRVLLALAERRRAEALSGRTFWRLALPAAAAAAILATVALRSPSTGAEASVTLASWYPLSADPTSQP